jgi:hypothetical protein
MTSGYILSLLIRPMLTSSKTTRDQETKRDLALSIAVDMFDLLIKASLKAYASKLYPGSVLRFGNF